MADSVLIINGYNRSEGHLEPEYIEEIDYLGVDFRENHYVSSFSLTDQKFPNRLDVYELITYDENDGESVLTLVEDEGLVRTIYHLMREKFFQEKED